MNEINYEVLNEILKLIYVGLLFLVSGWVTFTTTKLLDSYMKYGEILDFIRLRIAKYFGQKIEDLDFDFKLIQSLDSSNYESDYPYFERQEKMDIIYWKLAYYSKPFKLFICPDCMSVYVALFVSIGFSLSLGFTIVKVLLFWIFSVLISWSLLNKNSTG